MKLLDSYFSVQKEIYDYFGYQEDWKVLPIDDSRKYFWRLDAEEGRVEFADTEEELESQSGNYYENEIFTYGHLPKWVYRGKDYTMVVVDTHTDGNKFLQIFSNCNERP
jgi:hypothetical protein